MKRVDLEAIILSIAGLSIVIFIIGSVRFGFLSIEARVSDLSGRSALLQSSADRIDARASVLEIKTRKLERQALELCLEALRRKP